MQQDSSSRLFLYPLPLFNARMIPRYTLANYMRIVTYKTAYYSFYLPVACGMVLSGIKDEAAFKLAEKICVEMGQYFQVRREITAAT